MKRGLSTALALAAVLNLLVGLPAASGPEPQPSDGPGSAPANVATDATAPAAPAPPPAPGATDGPEGGQAVPSPMIGTGNAKHGSARHRHARRARTTAVKAAGAGSVTIKDFSYAPKSVSVSVGDSVTWSNQGPTDHTATAKDGSFDTGTLKKGQSGSHTFTRAGTFSYFCTLHPFMKATVVVAGSGGSGGSSGSPAPGSAGSTASGATASPSKQALPKSGVDVGSLLLSGALLLGSGLLLRRRTSG